MFINVNATALKHELTLYSALYCLSNRKRQLTEEGATRVQENENKNARNEQIKSYQNTQNKQIVTYKVRVLESYTRSVRISKTVFSLFAALFCWEWLVTAIVKRVHIRLAIDRECEF